MGSFTKVQIYLPSEQGSGGGGGGNADTAFNGNRPITRNVNGLNGVTPGGADLKTVLENILYPAVAPTCSLSVNNPTREVGDSTAYTLSWSVARNTNPITAITIDGIAVTGITGNNQSSTKTGNVPASTGTFNFAMTVSDGGLNSSASATLQYLNRMFWGALNKNSGISDADILGLSGSELRSNKTKSFTNLGGGGTYLIFAFPSAWGNPSFTVNGLANTAFTKIRSNSAFINQYGASVLMDVWVSDNNYNSALGSLAIS